MEQILELIITLNSGEELSFKDNSRNMIFSSDYNSIWSNNDYPEFKNNLCNEVLKISSSVEDDAFQNYSDFLNFCKKNILPMTKENISNIVIKDNFDNIYYNLSMNQIYNLTIQSGTEVNANGIFGCVLSIYIKGE